MELTGTIAGESSGNTTHFFSKANRSRVDNINMNSLIRVEAWSNYSRLFFADGKTLVVPKVLKRLAACLDSDMFIRAHNTHLINLHYVTGWNAYGEINLQNGDCIPVSRRRRKNVLHHIGSSCDSNH